MDLFKLASTEVQDEPLMACIFGLTRKGKSTALGTIGEPTLYLYSQFEEHGFRTAAKMNQELFDNNPIFGVNISLMEELDVKINTFKGLPAKKGYEVPKVGEVLNNNLMVHKLHFYLSNVPSGTGAVVLDSITDFCASVKETDIFVNYATVKTKEGMVYSNFQERAAYTRMLKDIMTKFALLQHKGISTFATISAKAKYDEEGNILQLLPELPMYGVVEEVLKSFPDVLPVDTAVFDGVEHRVFAMGLCVGKTQLVEKSKVTKAKMYTQGRLNSLLGTISLGMNIDYLPVNISQIKNNLAILKHDQETLRQLQEAEVPPKK